MKTCFKLNVEGGYFIVTQSQNPEYPGIDVEFVADDDSGQNRSRPRILFEKPIGEDIRVLVWEDKDNEDYSSEITF